MEYRADPIADVWHFCPTCRKWPETPIGVIWLDEPPTIVQLCSECIKLMPGAAASRPT